MKINRITLENFGSYEGEATFETREQDGRNIILIGGKNGAGKTTTMQSVIGLIPKNGGSVIYDGQDISKHPCHFRFKLPLKRILLSRILH